jgi:hypothetical protein
LATRRAMSHPGSATTTTRPVSAGCAAAAGKLAGAAGAPAESTASTGRAAAAAASAAPSSLSAARRSHRRGGRGRRQGREARARRRRGAVARAEARRRREGERGGGLEDQLSSLTLCFHINVCPCFIDSSSCSQCRQHLCPKASGKFRTKQMQCLHTTRCSIATNFRRQSLDKTQLPSSNANYFVLTPKKYQRNDTIVDESLQSRKLL